MAQMALFVHGRMGEEQQYWLLVGAMGICFTGCPASLLGGKWERVRDGGPA